MDTSLFPPFVGEDALPVERMHWVRVPYQVVLDLYKDTLRIQRNHLRRATDAKHLTSTESALHTNFLATRTRDGKMHLIDGYTRITTMELGVKPKPETVWLGVVDCETANDADKLYDAVDSKAAVKRGRDAFEEGLRRAKLIGKVSSPAFLRAQAVSAVTTATGERDVRKAVYESRKGIQTLDPIGVKAGRAGLPAGALAALLVIAGKESGKSAAIQEFAAALQSPKDVPAERKKDFDAALKCAEALKQRREANALSGKNVTPIMELVLGYWEQHQGRGGPRVNTLTKDEYLAAA